MSANKMVWAEFRVNMLRWTGCQTLLGSEMLKYQGWWTILILKEEMHSSWSSHLSYLRA